MSPARDKTLMRSLGEFFGHVVRGLKTDPAAGATRERTVVRKEVEEVDRGDMVLRRTTIEEIEIRRDEATEDPRDD